MSQIRLASINIERSKHLRLVEKFLRWYEPDVLCLQELCQRDIPFFEDLIGHELHYVPMCYHPAEEDPEPVGVGLIAWGAMQDVTVDYYHGQPHPLRHIRFITEADGYIRADNDSISNMLLCATYQGFRIGTTHLNVTRQGQAEPWQMESAAKLVKLAQAQTERAGGLLLCGDFNAPRGRATFDILAKAFTDGIPPGYTTSIDGSIHKAGQLPYMVDGLFHTPSYRLDQPRLHTGVSDHCALTCTLLRNEG